MSRFTLIIPTTLAGECNKTSKQCKGTGRTSLYSYIKRYVKERGCVFYRIPPGVLIMLSNGLSKEDHYKLYESINAEYPGIRVISVIHENPIYAIIKASKTMERENLYYEEGVEREYYIGYFAPRGVSGDIINNLAYTYSILFNTTMLLLNSGSLPLEVGTKGVLAVLNKSALNQLDYIKTRVCVNVGVDYSAIKAVRKAIG